jgi:hypothetical protein
MLASVLKYVNTPVYMYTFCYAVLQERRVRLSKLTKSNAKVTEMNYLTENP